MLDILFEDEWLVAMHKPNGLLVHRSRLAAQEKRFAMQELRNQIDQHVFPVHRLDRATSGLLLFAKDKETARHISDDFSSHNIEKKYLAWVRGYTPLEGEIDSPIHDETKPEPQEALTYYKRIATIELPFEVSRYPTSRYSLVFVMPQTGRRHQIRKHFAKLRHYIIGDKRHGDCKHNKYYRDHLKSESLLLHAFQLNFKHPVHGKEINIEAPLKDDFKRLVNGIQWNFDTDVTEINSLSKLI